jgi:CRISPR-associated protein Cmr1
LIKQSSKINISCAYPVNDNLWELRIWGWIPKNDLPAGFNRDGFLDDLKQALTGSGSVTIPWNQLLGDQTKNHKLKVWREFDSPRDTVKPNEGNISDYIQSLLNCRGCE